MSARKAVSCCKLSCQRMGFPKLPERTSPFAVVPFEVMGPHVHIHMYLCIGR